MDEKLARVDEDGDNLEKLQSPDELDMEKDREDDDLLPKEGENEEPAKNTFMSSFIWMVVNTLATIGIVGGSECLLHLLCID